MKFELDDYIGDVTPQPFFFCILTFLLTCPDSIVRRRNVINGS